MFNELAMAMLYVIVGSSLLFGLINLVRSNIYDIKQAKLRRQRANHPHTRWLRQRPLTSVIVYSRNDSKNIMECLSALAASSYKKIEVIVVDNASSDDSAKLIRAFIKNHPRLSARLVAKKIQSPRSEAIIQAAKYATGQNIAVLDANCTPDKQSLKHGILHMMQTKSEVVLLNTQAQHDYTIMGLADSLKSIILGRIKKAGNLITPGLDAHNYAAIYTQKSFLSISASRPKGFGNINSLRKHNLPIAYESLAVIKVHTLQSSFGGGTATARKPLAAIQLTRNLLSILEPFVIVFMIYVAIRFNSPGYVALAWLSFTSLLALAIWSDETHGLAAKFRLTLLALAAYSLYILRYLSGYINLLVRPAHR